MKEKRIFNLIFFWLLIFAGVALVGVAFWELIKYDIIRNILYLVTGVYSIIGATKIDINES
jgi:hypothetical protein